MLILKTANRNESMVWVAHECQVSGVLSLIEQRFIEPRIPPSKCRTRAGGTQELASLVFFDCGRCCAAFTSVFI